MNESSRAFTKLKSSRELIRRCCPEEEMHIGQRASALCSQVQRAQVVGSVAGASSVEKIQSTERDAPRSAGSE